MDILLLRSNSKSHFKNILNLYNKHFRSVHINNVCRYYVA